MHRLCCASALPTRAAPHVRAREIDDIVARPVFMWRINRHSPGRVKQVMRLLTVGLWGTSKRRLFGALEVNAWREKRASLPGLC